MKTQGPHRSVIFAAGLGIGFGLQHGRHRRVGIGGGVGVRAIFGAALLGVGGRDVRRESALLRPLNGALYGRLSATALLRHGHNDSEVRQCTPPTE